MDLSTRGPHLMVALTSASTLSPFLRTVSMTLLSLPHSLTLILAMVHMTTVLSDCHFVASDTQRQVCRRKSRPKFDRDAIKGLDKAWVSETLTCGLYSDWKQDIETDVNNFNAAALDLLTRHCPQTTPKAKKPFFSEELWTLRTEKNACLRKLKQVCNAYRRELQYAVLFAWNSQRRSASRDRTPCISKTWSYRLTLQCDALLVAGRFYNKLKATKQLLREAKHSHMQRFVDQLPPTASATDILAGLRPCIGTSNMRKRKGTSLPLVRDEKGRPCRSQAATARRWSNFFCDMEGGSKMNLDQQPRRLWIQGLASEKPDMISVQTTEMPTLTRA